MIIDTHCHLSYPDYQADIDDVLSRAAAAGAQKFLTVATGPNDWQPCLDLAEKYPSIRVALGIHPNEADLFSEQTWAELSRLASAHKTVMAIGETGLDYYRENSPREKQRAAFVAHLDLAEKLQRPFILHCRAAEEDMLAILEARSCATGGLSTSASAGLRGVWHCFGATQAFAERAIKLGLYFGLGGVTTYPKADDVRRVAAMLPADRIVLETDCPFLPPQGWRGKRNEPAYLSKVVEVLAAARSTSAEEIERITTENAQRLFGTW